MKEKIKKITPNFLKVYYRNFKKKNRINKIVNEILTSYKNSKQAIFIFNTPVHCNLGDQAIIYAEYVYINDICNNPIIEVPHEFVEDDSIFSAIVRTVRETDLVCIHGGGYIGDTWIEENKSICKIINRFEGRKLIVFPQTAHFSKSIEGQKCFVDSKKVYSNKKNLYICAREKVSYEFMKENFKNTNILLVPDIVLYLNLNNTEIKRKNEILLLLRRDKEKKINNDRLVSDIDKKYNKKYNIILSDTVYNENVYKETRYSKLLKIFNECYKSKIVITDRLHGMVFAALTNTPCLVLPNFNHKILGVYEWIKHLNYIRFVNNEKDIMKVIEYLLKLKNCSYDNKKILKYFSELTEIILKK